MNVRRFTGKNAREAMAQVRTAWGDQAVVLSNRPIPGGVEILAMPSAEVPEPDQPPRAAVPATQAAPVPATTRAARPAAGAPVAPMSTVSFQQFVRERQQRDQVAQEPPAARPAQRAQAVPVSAPASLVTRAPAEASMNQATPLPPVEPGRFARQALQEEMAAAGSGEDMMAELKSMRGMIASQLATLSWFDTVRRSPVQTQLLRLMLANGFSPSLSRQLIQRLPADLAEAQAGQWLVNMLAHNLRCAPEADGIGTRGGVYAIVGPTGVGKTTTTAKIAAHFAMKHGAASVGLITVDTYRMAASDQLRAFGRLLNIPVHTARDGASLVDLLDLFTNKKLVLIDTVGVGQRDRRLAELFAALPADRVTRLLALNAGAQAETLEETVQAYGAKPGSRCVITKLDEAVKCGGIVDLAVRHQLVVEGFANGQRVPEDWHAARAALLVHKALLKQPSSVFTPDDSEMGLMLTTPPDVNARRNTAKAHHA